MALAGEDLELFAIVRFGTPEPPFGLEPGYPLMDHLILFQSSAGPADRRGIVVGVADSAIVFVRTICTGPPEDAFDDYGPYTIVLKGPAYR